MSKKKNEFVDEGNLLDMEFQITSDSENASLSTEVEVPEVVDPLDSYTLVWYKPKYQASLLRRSGTYFLHSRETGEFSSPAPLQGLLRELGLEEDLETLEAQLWVRGLAVPEQIGKLDLYRLAELVEDVRKRNK